MTQMNDEDILAGEKLESDKETSLRPQYLNDFIGQNHIKSNLLIFINAARGRKEALDHTLFYGPPGLGKTSLSQIIAKEIGVNFKPVSGPALTKAADLAAILTNLQEKDVLFIDEIHRLSTNVEEILYSAMEDYTLDIIIGEGPAARSVRIELPKFTLIGATTRLGLLSNPLRDRFGIPLRLSFYEKDDLSKIVENAARKLDCKFDAAGLGEIAGRSRGTPRIALRLLKRVRDFAYMRQDNLISKEVANIALNSLEVDKAGLDSNDIRYIKYLAENYNGGPVGVETIAAALSEQRDAIEDAIEPYLIQIGMLQRTPRGRMLTKSAFEHVGMAYLTRDNDNQTKLF